MPLGKKTKNKNKNHKIEAILPTNSVKLKMVHKKSFYEKNYQKQNKKELKAHTDTNKPSFEEAEQASP